ncbi:hypothetical protein OG777_09315 [Micromonospora peucetia]|uniref:Uncharacterized protein n=1 Tax=Micromonospora peucetia TaxID=47871 RepID=A0A1C6UP59_9ACTN|nr:hypothetical protein [Micromonospora peucetia]MCX4387127.1 hypothetical protein [Micromonospora peucetia]WSA34487.1 hypothetical protein OIE14_10795 [Micromonospora peucetia]SCL55768.1 hypothetical protein GA0070608_1542 [Micromonospora peucetia]
MALIFLALLLLALAWPVVAVGAAVLVSLAALALRDARATQAVPRMLTRAGWLLTGGAALTACAAYGYGLRTTTFGAVTDPDDRCGLARPDLYGYGHRGPDDGSSGMWPLRDTTCGPDLVPGFVNPLVAGSAALFVALTVIMIVVRIRARRRLPSASRGRVG